MRFFDSDWMPASAETDEKWLKTGESLPRTSPDPSLKINKGLDRLKGVPQARLFLVIFQ